MSNTREIPERERSHRLINFMDVTGSDAALASSLLLENGWDLEAAVTKFYMLFDHDNCKVSEKGIRAPIPSV